jgi:hypothetical protein
MDEQLACLPGIVAAENIEAGLLQVQVHAFGCQLCILGSFVQMLQDFTRQTRITVTSHDLELIAAVTDFNVQTAFQLTQVLVKLAAQ